MGPATYSGNPTGNPSDQVRFLIQDTGPDHAGWDWVFADAEIQFLLTELSGDTYKVAAELLFIWARKLAASPDFQIGRFRESNTESAKVLNEKATELVAQIKAQNAKAFAGGISVADKARRTADPDRTQGFFRRGQFDNRG